MNLKHILLILCTFCRIVNSFIILIMGDRRNISFLDLYMFTKGYIGIKFLIIAPEKVITSACLCVMTERAPCCRLAGSCLCTAVNKRGRSGWLNGEGIRHDSSTASASAVRSQSENTRRFAKAGAMLCQRLRRWRNIKPALAPRLLFAGQSSMNPIYYSLYYHQL